MGTTSYKASRCYFRDFDGHAARLIEACYDIEEDFAVEILTTNSELYFNYNPLQLAKENSSRSFLATRCVHKYLDKQWYGEVNNGGHSRFFIDTLILILCIFPPLIPIVAKLSKTLALKNNEDDDICIWYIDIDWHQPINGVLSGFIAAEQLFAFIITFFVLLVDYFPLNNNRGKRNGYTNIQIPITEIIVHICMLSVIVEEILEFSAFYAEKRASNSYDIVWKYFMDDKWNTLDLMAILFYLVGFITRFFVMESIFVVSKIFMCIALFLWYVRMLHLFVASERLGTKLLMIFNTMKDLLFFVCFILIFLIGYSVASYSLLTTGEQVIWDNSSSTAYTLAQDGSGLWNWTILRNVIDWGMWKIYGQVQLLSYSEVDGNIINADNDAYGTTAFILTIIFVCIANVLLLNVLVALFNVTLEKTKHNAHISWAYHRFLLVNEYRRKSPLPPPFNLFYYVYKLIEKIYDRFQNQSDEHTYGSLDGKSELDANIYDAITFNAMDQVKIGGTISTVSINFSKAPSTDKPNIDLFVVMKTSKASSPNTFQIIDKSQRKINPESVKGKLGKQQFSVEGLSIKEDQYLAIRFSPGSGNPYSTERRQYYCYYDDDRPYKNQCLEFTSCRTKGIAVSFQVQPETNAIEVKQCCSLTCRKTKTMNTRRQDDTFLAKRNTYRTYDNMLRERSIANEYWINVINRLKKEEKDENKQYTVNDANWEQIVQLVHQEDRIQN